jgi:hypothetical protein
MSDALSYQFDLFYRNRTPCAYCVPPVAAGLEVVRLMVVRLMMVEPVNHDVT